MGFPVGYTELLLPNLFLHTLSLLGLLRKFLSTLFRFLGFRDFLEPDISFSHPDRIVHRSDSISSVLIRESLPLAKFSDLVHPPESCAVCLHEFEADDEIRRLINCRHIFHKGCLDRWMCYDQKTCPLCRTPFISPALLCHSDERPSEIADSYGDSSQIPTGLQLLDLTSTLFSL